MNIGLKRGTVRLEVHNPEWGGLYAKEEELIRNTIGDLIKDIQHIGSTAVPDLHAKPIIDIVIAVADFSVEQDCLGSLVSLGYEYFEDRETIGDHFFAKGPDENRAYYIHMVQSGGQKWKEYLFFRNLLRQNLEIRREYDTLKLDLSKTHADDRKSYTDSKGIFVERILKSIT